MALRVTVGQGYLQYPLGKAADEYKTQVRFTAKKNISVVDQKIDAAQSRFLEQFDDEFPDEELQSDIKKFKGTNAASNIRPSQKVRVGETPSVVLYLPTGLQFQDGVAYENMDLGAIGAGVEAGISGVNAILSEGKAGIDSLIDSFSGAAASQSAKLGILRATKKFAPDEVVGGLKSKFGVTMNPNSRTLFKQPNMRQFSFTFKMIAKNAREAEEILKIVRVFREELYPSTIGGSLGGVEIGLGYVFPNKFDIEFLYDGKRMTNVPRIKPAYLTTVNTVFNQTAQAMHSDGNFNEVDITLSFSEERALTREDIVGGY